MTNAILEVDNLSKHFAGVNALHEVSFSLGEQQVLAILGPNGSGKTTLFNVLSGFMSPSGGTIRLRGRSIGGLAPRRLVRLGLARSFQESMAFSSFTVADSLALAQVGRSRKRADVAALIELCGLGEVAGLECRSLPYGIQRMLGVAIALSTDPHIVMLDEPAAGLSDDDADRLASVIRLLPSRGVTVLCIDHNLPFLLPLADHVVVLDAGQKIFEGSPDAARASTAVIEAYLGTSYE